ncbi:MAG: DUF5695 domain-containing protein [Candidatus Aminicenantales bacterium]
MRLRALLLAAVFLAAVPGALSPQPARGPASGKIEKGDFALAYDGQSLTGLAHSKDPYGAQLFSPGGRMVPIIKYRVPGGDWLDAYRGETRLALSPDGTALTYTDSVAGTVLDTVQTFRTDGRVLDWTIELTTRMAVPVTIGDLAVQIPWRFPAGEDPAAIFERSWTKHQLIAGAGSFLYFVRPNGEPPFLVVTPRPGTALEYSASEGRGGFRAFVHSGLTGGSEKRGTWRQPHTTRDLGPAGAPDSRMTAGFRFRWARSYDEIRDILYEEGLFDVRVVPGMTVPSDLPAQIALRSKARIESLSAEFPDRTKIADQGIAPAGTRVFRLEFRRLGENLITIHHDGGRTTILEFFVTEPLETLIKKRASFLVRRQQHRDPAKWYDGLFSVYDMRAGRLRGPDDTDGFDFWWGYVLACDDPALCKAPFLASKNVHFPVPGEIAAVEYYLEHFVWGKLQRTDKETPYPYGIHGVPNWLEARDPLLRARSSNNNLDRMKIWRSYDYPHMVMLYFHMYEIARLYPEMVHYLDAAGYLERAYLTARAYFLYPYEILPWYETYKWGCYNELVILNLMEALEKEGAGDKAAWLRAEWEKKVKYFVYDDKYPFRSEYSLDRTAFESSYALAKYGATHDMKPDENLWFDKGKQKWYSHPVVRREDARAFMDRQLKAGLAVRGWLEAAYYLLGADFTASSDNGALSYMAAMGGWGILDYGLNFAPSPYDWLQLGYASYLSSWALMNTGTPESNFGYWAPGPQNDGAAGWQFMTAKWGRAWIRKDVPRGAWPYDGEIDLGFGAALRMAATIVVRDPVFGWMAYGGALEREGGRLRVVPRDGLRQRFDAVVEAPASAPGLSGGPRRALKIELDRDGFAANAPIVLDTGLKSVSFSIENRTGGGHGTVLKLSWNGPGALSIRQDGKPVVLSRSGSWDYPLAARLTMTGSASRIEIKIE